jgi:hypothetical protein
MTSSGTPAPAPPASALARGGAGRAFLSILRRDLFVTNAELPVTVALAAAGVAGFLRRALD